MMVSTRCSKCNKLLIFNSKESDLKFIKMQKDTKCLYCDKCINDIFGGKRSELQHEHKNR